MFDIHRNDRGANPDGGDVKWGALLKYLPGVIGRVQGDENGEINIVRQTCIIHKI